MYKYYLVTHCGKKYKVKAECEDAAVAKLRICLQNRDQELFSTNINDGIGDIAKMLGGIAVAALENKKLLQSANPTITEGVAKSLAVFGTDIIAIGAELANFAKKSTKIK